MPNLFPDSIIDEIRDKTNIAEVIAQYIPLNKAGRNFKAPCPFHKEKTPSFIVSPAKGIFHCFGCGAGGNVFNFVMKHEGMDFPQVVRLLAKKAEVKLPAVSSFKRQEKPAQDLYAINELACSWYQDILKKPQGKAAVDYLKKRGYKGEAALKFRLGFAPSGNGLLSFMRSKGIAQELLEKLGLVIRKENNAYDSFRQRIIFPILDVRSRVLGFGARVLGDALPKYINSPETPIYNKGSHLYGLNFAKEEIRKQDFCIIVEGYVDVLSVYQGGIANIVASLGTALTHHQIRLLKRYTNNVVIVFDSDQAGELASLRNLDLLIEEDVNVKIVSLPKGEDPDSFLSKFGVKQFTEQINQAHELFEYKLRLLSRNFDLDTVEGKVGIANHMLPTIDRVQNAIRRSGYVKKLAQEFSKGEKSLGEEWILAELKKVKRNLAYRDEESFTVTKYTVSRPAEEMILKISLADKRSIEEIKNSLNLDDFQDTRIRETMRLIYRMHAQDEDFNVGKIVSYLKDESSVHIISRISANFEQLVDVKKSLTDCVSRIKKDNLQDRLNRLQREIKLAQSWGHKDKITELVGKYHQLMKSGVKKNEKEEKTAA